MLSSISQVASLSFVRRVVPSVGIIACNVGAFFYLRKIWQQITLCQSLANQSQALRDRVSSVDYGLLKNEMQSDLLVFCKQFSETLKAIPRHTESRDYQALGKCITELEKGEKRIIWKESDGQTLAAFDQIFMACVQCCFGHSGINLSDSVWGQGFSRTHRQWAKQHKQFLTIGESATFEELKGNIQKMLQCLNDFPDKSDLIWKDLGKDATGAPFVAWSDSGRDLSAMNKPIFNSTQEAPKEPTVAERLRALDVSVSDLRKHDEMIYEIAVHKAYVCLKKLKEIVNFPEPVALQGSLFLLPVVHALQPAYPDLQKDLQKITVCFGGVILFAVFAFLK